MSECKIDHLVERLNLSSPPGYDSLDEYLLARWQGTDGHPPDGYGTLTTWFNKLLMRDGYESKGRETLGVRIDSEYGALMGDDDVIRGEVEDSLAADGINPKRLRKQFISRSTMRRHLTGCLNAEKVQKQDGSDWERAAIDGATTMAHRRIIDALESLASKGKFPEPDEVTVDISVQVSCADDPYHIPVMEAIDSDFNCGSTGDPT